MGTTKKFGNYELIAKVGQGGMGAVYRARQVAMDRIVAVKILPKNLAVEDGLIHRFLREAQMAGRCSHPNLVHVYEVDLVDGYYFFSMEYMAGPTLERVLEDEGPLEEDTAVYYMTKIAGGLEEAHHLGIVHRDVKPENIMLTEQGEPKLGDLGIAKPMSGEMDLTMTGSAVGTPRYMSPEQARGDTLDGRTDLYSLGSTFYHLLSGEPAFSATTLQAVAIKQATEDPKPLRLKRPDISRRTEAVIMKLLAREPDDRYQDASTLIEDLEAVAAGKKPRHVSVASDRRTGTIFQGMRRKPARPVRKSNTGVLIGAIVGAVVLIGILAMLFTDGTSEKPARPRPAPEKPEFAKPELVVPETPGGPRPTAWMGEWRKLPGRKPKGAGGGSLWWASFDTRRRQYLYFDTDFSVFSYDMAGGTWEKISESRKGNGTTWPESVGVRARSPMAPYDRSRDRVWFGITMSGKKQWTVYFDTAKRVWQGMLRSGFGSGGGGLCRLPSKDLVISTSGRSAYARLDPKSLEWKAVETTGPFPGRTLRLAVACDTKRGTVIVPCSLTGGMYALDLNRNEWQKLSPVQSLPGAAASSRVVYDEGNDLLVVVSTADMVGEAREYRRLENVRKDIWVYDAERNTWSEVEARGDWPPIGNRGKLSISRLCCDPEGRQLLGHVQQTGEMWALKLTGK